jgi:CHAD domain-containing protein
MSRIDHNKLRHRGKATAPAHEPKREKPKGGWSHIKREPVKHYTQEEMRQWQEALR